MNLKHFSIGVVWFSCVLISITAVSLLFVRTFILGIFGQIVCLRLAKKQMGEKT